MKNNKISKIIKLILLVFVIGVVVLGITMIAEYNSKGEGNGEQVTIEIEQGEGIWDIATKLQKEDLINYRIVFFLKARTMGASAKLRYGTFVLQKGSGLEQVINDLVNGGAQKAQVMFTVPEGYTIELIAKKLEKEGICSEQEFLQAVQQDYDYWFLDLVPANAEVKYRLQGFLYPETYAISEDMMAEDIVKVMLDQFDKKFTPEMRKRAEEIGKSVYEIVIEASIIERETMKNEEKKTVAGVIENRLEKEMRLEMCPTVLYPITNGIYDKNTVTYKDTDVESPYNTYRNKGLPVGPIASPDVLSMEAALYPEEHDYFFYHTDPNKNDGSHIFTTTYQEHKDTQ